MVAARCGEGHPHTLHPGLGCRFVLNVALGTGVNPSRAELFQSLVELFARAAEVGIGFVAQREHGIAQVIYLWRGAGVKLLPEPNSIIRRIAVAPGAGHDDEASLCREVHGGKGIQLQHARGESAVLGVFRETPGQLFGGAGLAAIHDEQRFG